LGWANTVCPYASRFGIGVMGCGLVIRGLAAKKKPFLAALISKIEGYNHSKREEHRPKANITSFVAWRLERRPA